MSSNTNEGEAEAECRCASKAVEGTVVKVEETLGVDCRSDGELPKDWGNHGDDQLMTMNSANAVSAKSEGPGSFVCQQCDDQQDTLEQFIQHMRTAHLQQSSGIDGHNSFSPLMNAANWCPICGMEMTNRMKSKMHLAEHYLDSRSTWRCQKCVRKCFNAVQELREHMAQCHVHTLFRCAICLELFSEREELTEHLLMLHSSKEQLFRCAACELDFDARGFEFHIGQVHAIGRSGTKGQPKKSVLATRSSTLKKETTNGKVAKCAKLVQFSTPPAALPSLRSLQCVVCDVHCVDELSLDQHRLFEHCKVPKGNWCVVCRCPLANLGAFVEHSLAHRNPLNEQMSCVICHQSVRGNVQLEMHGKYHLGLLEEGEKMQNEAQKEAEARKEAEEARKEVEEARMGSPVDDERLLIMPTMMECKTCKKKVPNEEYARHLLLHVMVGTLKEGTFGNIAEDPTAVGSSANQQHHQDDEEELSTTNTECHCERTLDDSSMVQLNAQRERINNDSMEDAAEEEEQKQNGGGGKLIGKLKKGIPPRHPPKHLCLRQKTDEQLPIRCEKCKQSFASRGHLNVNRRRHKKLEQGKGTMAKCRICDRRFHTLTLLEQHAATHRAKFCRASDMLNEQ